MFFVWCGVSVGLVQPFPWSYINCQLPTCAWVARDGDRLRRRSGCPGYFQLRYQVASASELVGSHLGAQVQLSAYNGWGSAGHFTQ